MMTALPCSVGEHKAMMTAVGAEACSCDTAGLRCQHSCMEAMSKRVPSEPSVRRLWMWAAREPPSTGMMELLKSADVMRFGKPWLVASQRINLIRERLREMARHPMYHNEIGALNKSKRDREEYQRGPLQFTLLNEGDSHMENSEPSFGDHYSHEHGNGRASKICKMGDYGDINSDEPDLTIGKPGGYNEVSEFPDFAALGPIESI